MKRTAAFLLVTIQVYVLVHGVRSLIRPHNGAAVSKRKRVTLNRTDGNSENYGNLSDTWWINYTTTSSPLDYKAAAKHRWSTHQHVCSLPPLDVSSWIPADVHRPGQLIIIFQYGKCGSSAMKIHFKRHMQGKNGTKVYHVHMIDQNLQARIQQRMQQQEPVWIITMVRNRFVRDVSALFENHKYYNITKTTSAPQIIAKNQHTWYSATPRQSQHWYADCFRNATGVDLIQYASSFDFARRSLFVTEGLYRILLLRYEDIADWGRVLPHYFPTLPPNEFPFERPTAGWLNEAYKKVLTVIPYTQDEIAATMAGDTALFYTHCERQAITRAAARPLPAWLG